MSESKWISCKNHKSISQCDRSPANRKKVHSNLQLISLSYSVPSLLRFLCNSSQLNQIRASSMLYELFIHSSKWPFWYINDDKKDYHKNLIIPMMWMTWCYTVLCNTVQHMHASKYQLLRPLPQPPMCVVILKDQGFFSLSKA